MNHRPLRSIRRGIGLALLGMLVVACGSTADDESKSSARASNERPTETESRELREASPQALEGDSGLDCVEGSDMQGSSLSYTNCGPEDMYLAPYYTQSDGDYVVGSCQVAGAWDSSSPNIASWTFASEPEDRIWNTVPCYGQGGEVNPLQFGDYPEHGCWTQFLADGDIGPGQNFDHDYANCSTGTATVGQAMANEHGYLVGFYEGSCYEVAGQTPDPQHPGSILTSVVRWHTVAVEMAVNYKTVTCIYESNGGLAPL